MSIDSSARVPRWSLGAAVTNTRLPAPAQAALMVTAYTVAPMLAAVILAGVVSWMA